ncbi:hypothetical protein PspLS_00170 [Pyricularia sp. CBS 133598]|nr:hypothetical protein PspLS_00170 [Pyricularia sp. CBS 133598]
MLAKPTYRLLKTTNTAPPPKGLHLGPLLPSTSPPPVLCSPPTYTSTEGFMAPVSELRATVWGALIHPSDPPHGVMAIGAVHTATLEVDPSYIARVLADDAVRAHLQPTSGKDGLVVVTGLKIAVDVKYADREMGVQLATGPAQRGFVLGYATTRLEYAGDKAALADVASWVFKDAEVGSERVLLHAGGYGVEESRWVVPDDIKVMPRGNTRGPEVLTGWTITT